MNHRGAAVIATAYSAGRFGSRADQFVLAVTPPVASCAYALRNVSRR
jgi:hypothetical protein